MSSDIDGFVMDEGCGQSVLRRVAAVCLLGPTLLLFSGCQTYPEMQEEVREMRRSLEEKNRQYTSLRREMEDLREEKAYIEAREQVLQREKDARRAQAESNIKNVREFTEIVAGVVREASENMDVWDYIGGELIARKNTLDEANVLLVDMENVMPDNGRLSGARVYVESPARLQFCLLRPGDDGRRLTVVDVGNEYQTDGSGIVSWTFDLPVRVQKGDLIGFYVNGEVPIPYDAVATGNVAVVSEKPEAGKRIAVEVPSGRHTKAFSFGVIGHF